MPLTFYIVEIEHIDHMYRRSSDQRSKSIAMLIGIHRLMKISLNVIIHTFLYLALSTNSDDVIGPDVHPAQPGCGSRAAPEKSIKFGQSGLYIMLQMHMTQAKHVNFTMLKAHIRLICNAKKSGIDRSLSHICTNLRIPSDDSGPCRDS